VDGRKIVLGISGGIAAYKSLVLVRLLRERGAEVRVVTTRSAQEFVTPLSFQAISGNPVHTELFDLAIEHAMGHIELGRWADLVLVAPASAGCLARIAHGLADDLLTTVCLATSAPIAVAPAMNQQMWRNRATQDNVRILERRGARIWGPAEGSQACGDEGPGRMIEPEDLARLVDGFFSSSRVLAGVGVLVTAGPTREEIDPVRFLSNRSSGKMGYAVAEALRDLGAVVTLVSGPVALAAPPGIERVEAESAAQMLAAVMERVARNRIFVSAAAVADYRPERVENRKIKKSGDRLELRLVPNPDILGTVAGLPTPPFTVGFAAETNDIESYALAKLRKKNLDLIAANRVGVVGSGFDADENALLVLWEGGRKDLGRGPKKILARHLAELIAERYHGNSIPEPG